MPQEFASPHRKKEIEEVTDIPQVSSQANFAEIDSLLDEIDEVLEKNATSFIEGFVQKGGQ
ncbi:MAG: ubiquitin-like protein Pup [Actinomycetaceae bacterium]|nr:ubiquitin-like protein Pup [Actinomycetaceae bacterium]